MGRGTYASGKWALGECARSGRKMLLRNMIADGYYPNLIVDPEWYEPKHPQESLPSVHDPVTLFRPAPERDLISVQINLGGVPTFDPVGGGGFGDMGDELEDGGQGGGVGGASLVTGYAIGNVGFSEVPNTEIYNSPDDWTLIEAWDTNNGVGMNEMASIDTAYGGQPRGSAGAVWNPEGTRLTLHGGAGGGTVKTFTLSIPFDPDSASETASRSIQNASHLHMNASGSQLLTLVIVGDLIRNYPCSNFVIGSDPISSDINKSELGYIGSTDGGFYPERNLESFLWDGTLQFGDERCRRVSLSPDGNLDSFVLGTATDPTYNVNASIGGSKISNDGLSYYRGVSAAGVEFVQMSTPYDPATISFTTHDIVAEVGFFVDYVVVNPDDTSEVWIVGDNSGGLQLARMATNV